MDPLMGLKAWWRKQHTKAQPKYNTGKSALKTYESTEVKVIISALKEYS